MVDEDILSLRIDTKTCLSLTFGKSISQFICRSHTLKRKDTTGKMRFDEVALSEYVLYAQEQLDLQKIDFEDKGCHGEDDV